MVGLVITGYLYYRLTNFGLIKNVEHATETLAGAEESDVVDGATASKHRCGLGAAQSVPSSEHQYLLIGGWKVSQGGDDLVISP